MQAARLLLLLLLVLVAVVLVVVVLRRGSAQRDAHRAEAAGLRSEAETLASTAAGQGAFADQAAERAEVARVEAEEKAREAARLEEEAAGHRAAVEATQREYEATLRRADEIDPDVKASAVREVPEGEPAGDGSGLPMTRAERREARESGDAGYAAPAAASSAATAGAAGAAAAGATAWAARGAEDEQQSERIASAADYRDAVATEQTEVYPPRPSGSDAGMSDPSSTETQHTPAADDGLAPAGTHALPDDGPASVADVGNEHRTELAGDGAGDAPVDAADGGSSDVAHDVESPSGEWGGPPQDEPAEQAEVTFVEPEAYATTEPVMASEQSAPVSPDSVDTDGADQGASDVPASGGRRISAFEEIRDGGFGVGSAAPLEGGAQPLDHPVQGFHDMTFRAPGDPGYDSAEPDVWFYDEGAAERSGFRRADG